ncbi:chemotaxis protein-glutamate methylesterase [Adhaeribacter aerolatus]|uniref:protein-glutamate methylesterase n=1 Tax=Adhaeribacter aerolatus TaxID=670289 RepID=A0A512AYS7_9BACT|nr:chemotaxis protein CheB [Adhaeribacter aerolatus]GEO04846.1 chemotaxis protein-glutamate methylesterase [Adhaeribacter aerolatus]
MHIRGHNIIVIGTSAGGMEALCRLVEPLPADLPAAIFVVQHLAADSNIDFLVKRLASHTVLSCVKAQHNTHIEYSAIYMAPPDHHLLIDKKHILVARGPRENQFRPSIDPLFRSAAAFHGAQTIGVTLTGFMNDGLVGMNAIQRCGGFTVVQDPADAEYPDLPRNILRHMQVTHTVPIAQMGELLTQLVHQPSPDSVTVPPDILLEAQIAQRIMINSENANIEDMDKLGKRVPYTCPECGGTLWELTKEKDNVQRFRCHTGHAYTDQSLLANMNTNLEETLYVAMRTLEERRSMLTGMAEKELGNTKWANMQRQRADEMKVHIERIRRILEAATISDQEHQHRREAG